MPINEIEYHPFLKVGEISGATRLLLGSFPVYQCTDPDNNLKIRKRDIDGSVKFFYGSCRSRFWGLYKVYVDNSITLPPNPEQIFESLVQRNIAISDMITCCSRVEFNSGDTDLRQKKYNTVQIQRLINNGVSKILCTSKHVLDLFETQVICKRGNPIGSIDIIESEKFQDGFIYNLNGNTEKITNPIARVYTIGKNEIQALSIPSPGSPQRRIDTFGFKGNNTRDYVDQYFENAFRWFAS